MEQYPNSQNIKMQKCDHNVKITHFCIYNHCAAKQSAGCQKCMKKYHNHVGNVQYLTIQQLQKLISKFSVDNTLKPKCRSFQENIYNFFHVIKNEINNTVDAACKIMINKIGYPFLSSLNHLTSFKRIKNKQYRKLNVKELKKFYNDSINININSIAIMQKQLYTKQIYDNFTILENLQNIIKSYQSTIKSLCKHYQHDASVYKKFQDLKRSLISLIGSHPAKSSSIDKSLNSSSNKQSALLQSMETSPSSKILKNKLKYSGDIFSDKKSQAFQLPLDKSVKLSQSLNLTESKQTDAKDNLMSLKNSRGKFGHSKNYSFQQSQLKIFTFNQQLLPTEQLVSTESPYTLNQKEITLRKQRLMQLIKTKDVKKPDNQIVLNINSPPRLHRISQISTDQKNNNYQTRQGSIDHHLDKIRSRQSSFGQLRNLYEFKARQKQVQQYKFVVTNLPLIEEKQINQKPQIVEGEDELGDREEESIALYFESFKRDHIKCLQAALKCSKANLSAAERLSNLYLQQNQPKQCLTLCNDYLILLNKPSFQPEDRKSFLINKACAFNMLGRYSETITLLEKQIFNFDNQAKIFKNLGDAYYSVGFHQKCQYNYEKAIFLDPSLDEALYNLAVCLFNQGSFHNSKLIIEKALSTKPNQQEYIGLLQQVNKRLQKVKQEDMQDE